MSDLDHEKRRITMYVEAQSAETVIHAEKMTTLGMFGRKYDVWDVHTEQSRWWAITNMLNLYSQDRFHSMDETFTFHIGLMTRLSERDRRSPEDDDDELIPSAWRRYGRAIDAYNLATEPEEYQAVAILCREALLAMVRDLSTEDWLLEEERPKLGSFKEWASLIFRSLTTGRLRSYLTSLSEKTWDLAVSIQHDTSADALAVEILLDATRNVFDAAFLAVLRNEKEDPAHCPKCGSVKLQHDYRPESGLDYPHFVVCGSCGWETQAEPLCESAAASQRAYFEKHGDGIAAQARALNELRGDTGPTSAGEPPADTPSVESRETAK